MLYITGVEPSLCVADLYKDHTIYCLTSDSSWSTLTKLPQGFSDYSAAVITRRGVIVAGGGPTRTRCQEYMAQTREWRDLPDMTTPRPAATGVVVDDNTFAVLGGRHLSSCEVLDLSQQEWRPLPDNKWTGYFPIATCVNDTIFVVYNTGNWGKSPVPLQMRKGNYVT